MSAAPLGRVLAACLLAAGVHAQPSVPSAAPATAPAPASTPTSEVTTAASAEVEAAPPLEQLLDEARARAEAGGEDAEGAKRRWEFLVRVLRAPPPLPGEELSAQDAALTSAAARLEALKDGELEVRYSQDQLDALRARVQSLAELGQHRRAHLAAVEAEVTSLEEERARVEAEGDGEVGGVDRGLRLRGLDAALEAQRRARETAHRGVELAGRLRRVLDEEHDLGRHRLVVEAADLEAKRLEIERSQAELDRRAERAASEAEAAEAAARSAELEKQQAADNRDRAEDRVARRIFALKAARSEEEALAARQKAELARVRQEVARGSLARARGDLEFLASMKQLREDSASSATRQRQLDELRVAIDRARTERANEQARLDWTRTQLDRLRARRKKYRSEEADLLEPDLAPNLRGAAWVLRTILEVVERREDLAQETRDLRRQILEDIEARLANQEVLLGALQASLEEPSDLLEPENDQAPLDHATEALLDLRAGLEGGVLGLVLGAAGARVQRSVARPEWGSLGLSLLLGLALYLVTLRVLGFLGRLRDEALALAHEAEAIDGDGGGA